MLTSNRLSVVDEMNWLHDITAHVVVFIHDFLKIPKRIYLNITVEMHQLLRANPIETGDCCVYSYLYDPLAITRNAEACFHDFLVILKRKLQNS